MRQTVGMTGLHFGAKIYVLICFNPSSLFFDRLNCKDVTLHNPLYLGTLQARSSVNPSVLIRVTRNKSCNVLLLYEQNKRTINLVLITSSWLLHQQFNFKAKFSIILKYNIEDFFLFEFVVHRVNPTSLIALD